MAIATQPSGSRDQAPAPSIKRCLDATIQAADRLDDWIRRYVVDHPLRYHPTVVSSDQRRSAVRQEPPFSRVSAPVRRSRLNTPPTPPRRAAVAVRGRGVWLLAIGDSLKAQYDALATPIPPHIAGLVEQLEMKK
jgi:hypothetical protein